ncbi:MAG: SDR family oxidoreductase [Actinobacteria bacterium]|nr:SDR family oxidoreductase [Actinomycetota bacterium]
MNGSESTALMGKTALVTGAGSGIGRASALALAASGAKVIAVDRDEQTLKELQADCGADIIVADLTTPEKYFPDDLKIDILINNAGIQHVSPVEQFPMEKVDLMLALMLRTPFYLIQKSLPYMYRNKWGRIIGISSVHGHVASPFKSVYVAVKHGMEGLHKTVSLEAGANGVTANTIAPAFVRTNLMEKQIASQAELNHISKERVLDEIMLAPVAIKRLIEPNEIAAMVLYLCGPNSNSITGSSFSIDNGWTAK